MNGKQAKRIRKSIYGTDLSPRYRKYKRMKKEGGKGTFIISDDNRRVYKKAKKMYTKGEINI